MKAEIPINEAERIKALRSYRILDTVPETSYDDITLLASHICDTPVALVSLIDSDRQWFKSRAGVQISETSRDIAFCAHAILSPDLLIVPDARQDIRFADNPLVIGEPWIRFYAGAPLIAPDGNRLGTVCVIDHVQRILTETQAHALRALSRQVIAQLELRRHVALQEDHRKTMEELNVRLKSESVTDDVTGFHNTRFLHQYLDEYLAGGTARISNLSLIFFDMDSFKGVVDAHGHLLGAKVLREVAQVVDRELSPHDRIVRYGGDEFVVILPDQDRTLAHSTAQRIHTAISAARFLTDEAINLKATASFGLAVYPDDANNRKDLLLRADEQLFRSKKEGRNRISGAGDRQGDSQ